MTPRCSLVLPLLLALASCATVRTVTGIGFEHPSLAYESWSAEGLDLDGVTLIFRYRLQNPNDFGLDLKSVDYRVEVEGHEVASGTLGNGLQVPPRGETAVVFPVRLLWRDVPDFVKLLATRSDAEYRVAGKVGLGSALGTVEVAFEHRDRVPLPRPPTLQLQGVAVHELSMASVSLDVRVHIENPNAFAIPVGPLTYGLRVGDRDLAPGSHPAVSVPARGHAVIVVPIRLSLKGAAEAIAEVLRGAELRLRGLLDLSGVQWPVDLKGWIDGR